MDQLELVEKIFNKVFLEKTTAKYETCDEENDTIVLSNGLNIRKIRDLIKVNTLKGPMLVDGYVVEKTIYISGYPNEPDSTDYEELGEFRNFNAAVELAVKTHAGNLAEWCLESSIPVEEYNDPF